MSTNSIHNLNGQPPVFAEHAEERYNERTPVADPVPILDAYHQSLIAYIEDDCKARLYPPYNILFIKRGQVIKTELVADYDRLSVPCAMWCDECGKPFRSDIRCKWCDSPVEGTVSDGAVTLIQKGGK